MTETETTAGMLATLLPTGAFVPLPFNWSLGKGPAWEVTIGISEERFVELGLPAAAFRPNTDCWQVATAGKPIANANVKLVTAMGPDVEAATIRAMGQLDILKLLATGTWSEVVR